MPEITEEAGTHWENCNRTEEFKESAPDEFRNSLRRLAELEDIRIQIKELREIEADLCQEIYDLLPNKEMDIGGIGRVTKSMGSSKKWDHENLWYTVTARALDKRIRRVDPETGEITLQETEHAAVMRVLKECAYVSYWKKGKLDEYGIDTDEYCETTWTKPGIRIKS